jgi:hypothetical protein
VFPSSFLFCIESSSKFHIWLSRIILLIVKISRKALNQIKMQLNGCCLILKVKANCDKAVHATMHKMFAQQWLVGE